MKNAAPHSIVGQASCRLRVFLTGPTLERLPCETLVEIACFENSAEGFKEGEHEGGGDKLRSVFALLKEQDKNKIIDKLKNICNDYSTEQWNYLKDNDPVLYIYFDHHDHSIIQHIEPECDEYLIFKRKIIDNLDDYNILIIDVSGRHCGQYEVLRVLKELLSSFDGYAMDDYTDYLWSITEITTGKEYMNHKFFDYNGWYEENKAKWI